MEYVNTAGNDEEETMGYPSTDRVIGAGMRGGLGG